MHPQQEQNARDLSLPRGMRAPLISISSPSPLLLDNVALHGHSMPHSSNSLDEQTKFLDDGVVLGNYGAVNTSSSSAGMLCVTSLLGAN